MVAVGKICYMVLQVASTDAVREVLETWDLEQTERMLEKLSLDKQRRKEAEQKRQEAEKNKYDARAVRKRFAPALFLCEVPSSFSLQAARCFRVQNYMSQESVPLGSWFLTRLRRMHDFVSCFTTREQKC